MKLSLVILCLISFGFFIPWNQQPSIVGKWQLKRFYSPVDARWIEENADNVFFEFHKDNKVGNRSPEAVIVEYTVDMSVTPHRLEIKSNGKTNTSVFKIEGKTLIIKFNANFEAVNDLEIDKNFIMEYERVSN